MVSTLLILRHFLYPASQPTAVNFQHIIRQGTSCPSRHHPVLRHRPSRKDGSRSSTSITSDGKQAPGTQIQTLSDCRLIFIGYRFFVNLLTSKSQWEEPVAPAQAESTEEPPSYENTGAAHPAALAGAGEKHSLGSNNPYNSPGAADGESSTDSDARLAAQLQAEEEARAGRGRSGDYNAGSSNNLQLPPRPESGGSHSRHASQDGRAEESERGHSRGKKGFFSKLMGKSSSSSSSGYARPSASPRPPQQYAYQQPYPPQPGYYGGGYPPQPMGYGGYGGYPGGGYYGQPQRSGMGAGGAAALGVGGGLLGGMLLADAFDGDMGGGDMGGGDMGGGDMGGGC